MVLTIKLAALLKLVAGDILNPVSIRRLHLDNRITNLKTNFSETQFKAYQSLLRWSQEVNLPHEKHRIVRYRYWQLGYRYYKDARKYHKASYYYAMSHLFGI
jgi:hypothetical protein